MMMMIRNPFTIFKKKNKIKKKDENEKKKKKIK